MNILQAIRATWFQKFRFPKFSGRASRSEFWWSFLVMLVVLTGYQRIMASPVGSTILSSQAAIAGWNELALGLLRVLIFYLFALPVIAVTVRRMHDTDTSTWWFLVLILGPIGILLMAIALALGPSGPNRHGPGPGQSWPQGVKPAPM